MLNRLLITLLTICISDVLYVNNLYGQWNFESWAEQMATNEEVSYQWENLSEDLAEWKLHPLNINQAGRKELLKFPFLSPKTVDNLLKYLEINGPLLSTNELWLVRDIDKATIQNLLPFIYIGPAQEESKRMSFKDIFKYAKQEISTRFSIPCQTKLGYSPYSQEEWEENPNKRYLGYSNYHNIRYRFQYKDQIYAGLTAEKDAGEPFFSAPNQKGYDFYSPYLFIRNIRNINALAIGNYRLSYGYGLVMNTDFGMGKTTMLSTFDTRVRGIKKHSSTDEYNYFQGAACSYKFSRRFTADLFYSFRKMDGIVDNQFITSLKTDGLHRTFRDFEKRNTFSNQLIGSNIDYNGKFINVGLTAVYNHFNKVLNPVERLYNEFYPRGSDFFNLGINYKFFWKNFVFSGETATDKKGKIATLNMLSYSPRSGTRYIVMNRYYDAAYQGIYARSLGEGSKIQNESAVYIGMETKLLRYFSLNCYGDFFYFPWYQYRVSELGTTGLEGVVQLSYSPTYQLNMFIRYRYKKKMKDYTDEAKERWTIPYIQQKWKYQVTYTQKDTWWLKTSVDYVRNNYQGQAVSQGFLVGQSAGFKLSHFPLKVDIGGAWFHTDNYDSRISMYEKGLLYTFSFPSLYGKGIRASLLVQYELNKHFNVQVKYGITCYQDRNEIGSSLEKIAGNKKSEVNFQLRYKF